MHGRFEDWEALLASFLETLEVLVSSLWKTPDMSLARLRGFTLSFPCESLFLFRSSEIGWEGLILVHG